MSDDSSRLIGSRYMGQVMRSLSSTLKLTQRLSGCSSRKLLLCFPLQARAGTGPYWPRKGRVKPDSGLVRDKLKYMHQRLSPSQAGVCAIHLPREIRPFSLSLKARYQSTSTGATRFLLFPTTNKANMFFVSLIAAALAAVSISVGEYLLSGTQALKV